jgi:hypothetical protein
MATCSKLSCGKLPIITQVACKTTHILYTITKLLEFNTNYHQQKIQNYDVMVRYQPCWNHENQRGKAKI